jgi:hypothetical protein
VHSLNAIWSWSSTTFCLVEHILTGGRWFPKNGKFGCSYVILLTKIMLYGIGLAELDW